MTQHTIHDVDSDIAVAEKVRLKRPNNYHVIFYNDDFTTMEFVITLLVQIFHHSLDDAQEITSRIHVNGMGIAGTYSLEVATQKRDDSLLVAVANGFPLRVEIESATD